MGLFSSPKPTEPTPVEKTGNNWQQILFTLPGVIASIVGIVMMAIGGTMLLNTGLKYFVLGLDTPSYFSPTMECEETLKWSNGRETPTQPTASEVQACTEKRATQEKARYKRDQLENIVNGGVTFIVGSTLYVLNRRRRKQDLT